MNSTLFVGCSMVFSSIEVGFLIYFQPQVQQNPQKTPMGHWPKRPPGSIAWTNNEYRPAWSDINGWKPHGHGWFFHGGANWLVSHLKVALKLAAFIDDVWKLPFPLNCKRTLVPSRDRSQSAGVEKNEPKLTGTLQHCHSGTDNLPSEGCRRNGTSRCPCPQSGCSKWASNENQKGWDTQLLHPTSSKKSPLVTLW